MDEKTFALKISDMGGRAYFAGGYVRDAVMGREPHDRDYVVCGVAEDVFLEGFPEAFKVGGSFPVFLLPVGEEMCEVAFARTEKKIGRGYRGFAAEFSPDVTIEDDLYRRDTTMNSMALPLLGVGLIDPYGGRDDIKNKIIRATSEHFTDDPVRALRAARQSAQFGFVIDHVTLKMMEACGPEVSAEPKERILAETEKALAADKPSIYFRALNNSHLLKIVFPWIYALIGKTQPPEYHPEGDAFEHTMMVLDDVARRCPRVEVRFAALMHDVGKGVTPDDMLPHHYGHEANGLTVLHDINRTLTLPRKWYKCAEFAIREHMRPAKIKQPGKVVDLLVRLEKHPIGADGFAAIIAADNGGEQADCLLNYERYMSAIKRAHDCTPPEKLSGAAIGEWIRQREIEEYRKEAGQ